MTNTNSTLYLKYRPNTFSDMVGNETCVEALKKMTGDLKKCPHSFLFHGPTGCGKTTLARIVARTLKCTGFDLHEIDSADFRGIDSIRELRKNTLFMPMNSACSVWLIDECHKLTNDAQNAFLKLLEDTPAHVYLLLCTTDPRKLLPAITGRCSNYNVNLLTDEEMLSFLKKIAKKEGEKLEKSILKQIAFEAQGHPRNALQILQQVLNAEPKNRLAIAKKVTQTESESIELCRKLIIPGISWKVIAPILKGLQKQEPETIRRHVLGYAQAVLLKNDNLKAGAILEEFIEPFYNSGYPGLVFACYSVVKG